MSWLEKILPPKIRKTDTAARHQIPIDTADVIPLFIFAKRIKLNASSAEMAAEAAHLHSLRKRQRCELQLFGALGKIFGFHSVYFTAPDSLLQEPCPRGQSPQLDRWNKYP